MGHRYITCDMSGHYADSMAERSVFPGFRDLDGFTDDLGRELAARRRAQGLSQSDVAERMGTSQSAVARLESGATNARLSTLLRYAEAVGCGLNIGLEHAP